jgi:ubiquinone/menaquinone biosynthesis C-methylase UbiE
MAQYRSCTQASYVGLDVTNNPYSENHPRVVDIVASVLDIPAPDSTYDLIFSVATLYQVNDSSTALSESYRVLRPRGRILLFDYNRRTQKKLELGETAKGPRWTQWKLRRLVRKVGFSHCDILVPRVGEFDTFERLIRILCNEFFGSWAVVTGIK